MWCCANTTSPLSCLCIRVNLELLHKLHSCPEAQLPAESQLPTEAQRPAESPLPAEAQLPADAQLPAESQLPTGSKLPVESQLPMERQPATKAVSILGTIRCKPSGVFRDSRAVK